MHAIRHAAGGGAGAVLLAVAACVMAGPTTRPATTRPATTQPATTRPAATQPRQSDALLAGPLRDRDRDDDQPGRGFSGKQSGDRRMGEFNAIVASLNLTEQQEQAVRQAAAKFQTESYLHRQRINRVEENLRNARAAGAEAQAKRLDAELKELQSTAPTREMMFELMIDAVGQEKRFDVINAYMDRQPHDPAKRVAQAVGPLELTDEQRASIKSLTDRYRVDVREFRRANFDVLLGYREQITQGGKAARRARDELAKLMQQGPGRAYVVGVAKLLSPDQREPFLNAVRSGKPMPADKPGLDL